MIYQLFCRLPTNEEFQKILDCFGLNSINDQREINLHFIKTNQTVHKLNKIKPLLQSIYVPCKHYYITNISYKRAMTILRQLLRLVHRKLNRTSIYYNKKMINHNYNIDCCCCKKKIEIHYDITLKF